MSKLDDLASELKKHNVDNAMYGDGEGITYNGNYFWFASTVMKEKCLHHHQKKLSVFEDKGDDSLCRRYRRLYFIKTAFQSKDEAPLTEQEWCDKWFRGQERGGISSSRLVELRLRDYNHQQMRHERQRGYNKDTITLRTLYEVRDDPDFKRVLQWTDYEPCVWLDKLVPADHFLNKNLGKWAWFINRQRGYQHFPFKLIHVSRRDGEFVYHAENQLTLPHGFEVKPSEIQFITLAQATQLYQTSIAAGHWSSKNQVEWGRVKKTDIWNPKRVNFTDEFHPELSEATWRKFTKSDEFAMIDGKKKYGEI